MCQGAYLRKILEPLA